MNCNEVAELLAAYALDALDGEEREAVRAHLATCSLHGELADLRQVAGGLAGLAAEQAPPAGLLGRIRSDIATRPASTRPASLAQARTGRWRRFAPYALAAAFAAIAIALGAWNVVLQRDEDGATTLVRTAATDAGTTERLVYVPEERVAIVTFEALPQLGAGRTYQVWTIRPGQAPVGIGLFNASADGVASVAVDVELNDGDVIAITDEPAGGSPQPTTAPLIATEL